MQTYKVYYQKKETIEVTGFFNISSIIEKDVKEVCQHSHVYLMETDAENLEDLFRNMQGENWSPNGEAREFIKSKRLIHTSMSVGDVAYEIETGKWYVVDIMGFRELA